MKYGLKKAKTTTVNGILNFEEKVLINEDGDILATLDSIFAEFDDEAISISVKRVEEHS